MGLFPPTHTNTIRFSVLACEFVSMPCTVAPYTTCMICLKFNEMEINLALNSIFCCRQHIANWNWIAISFFSFKRKYFQSVLLLLRLWLLLKMTDWPLCKIVYIRFIQVRSVGWCYARWSIFCIQFGGCTIWHWGRSTGKNPTNICTQYV